MTGHYVLQVSIRRVFFMTNNSSLSANIIAENLRCHKSVITSRLTSDGAVCISYEELVGKGLSPGGATADLAVDIL